MYVEPFGGNQFNDLPDNVETVSESGPVVPDTPVRGVSDSVNVRGTGRKTRSHKDDKTAKMDTLESKTPVRKSAEIAKNVISAQAKRDRDLRKAAKKRKRDTVADDDDEVIVIEDDVDDVPTVDPTPKDVGSNKTHKDRDAKKLKPTKLADVGVGTSKKNTNVASTQIRKTSNVSTPLKTKKTDVAASSARKSSDVASGSVTKNREWCFRLCSE